MKRWVNASVTRGEVIGWALAIPVAVNIWGFGAVTVKFVPVASSLVAKYPDVTPPFLRLCVSLGVIGLVVVFSLIGLLALGAQLSKQRQWVRVVAPVICYFLARAVNQQFFDSQLEFVKSIPTADGHALLDEARR